MEQILVGLYLLIELYIIIIFLNKSK